MAVQAKPGIRAVELAEKFEVSKRTIYRDIDGLSAVTPITSEGHGKGFRFIGKFMMYPPDLNDEESVALSMIPFVVDTDKLPRAFHSAFDKIMAAHKGEINKSINLIDRITERIQMGKPAYRPQSPNFLPVIIQAMLECRTLHTTYHTQYRNSTTVRQIDPYFLVPREQRFYLIGYCRKEERVRIFRVSRFLDAKMTEQTFDKGDFDIHRFLKDTWSIHRGDRKTTFKVKFSAAVARYVKEDPFRRLNRTQIEFEAIRIEILRRRVFRIKDKRIVGFGVRLRQLSDRMSLIAAGDRRRTHLMLAVFSIQSAVSGLRPSNCDHRS